MLGGVLRGRRTTLRPMRENDLPHVARWCADPRVRRFGERAFWAEPATSKTWKDRLAEASKDRETVLWAVEADGATAGSLLLRAHGAPFSENVDLVHFTVDPDRWRQGLGRDAALVAHRWIFDVARLRLCGTVVDADNVAALRILEGLGHERYAHGHRARYRAGAYLDQVSLVMSLETWDARFGATEREYAPLGAETER